MSAIYKGGYSAATVTGATYVAAKYPQGYSNVQLVV